MIFFYSNGGEKGRAKEELVLKDGLLFNLTTDTAILAGEILQTRDTQATRFVKIYIDLYRMPLQVLADYAKIR